jgi:hypothetical protein
MPILPQTNMDEDGRPLRRICSASDAVLQMRRLRDEGSPSTRSSISFGMMSLVKLPAMKEIGNKLTTSTSEHLGDKIDKSRFSFPTKKHLSVILLTLFTSLVVVNVLTYLVIKFALIEDLEDDTSAENSGVLPSREGDEYKLKSTWKVTNSNPIANLDDSQFNVYVGFVVWATVVLAGVGMELLVWTSFLKDGWSCEAEVKWKFAEFAFPLLGAVVLGLAVQHNYMALIFVIGGGLFKFGFPEILTHMHTALYLTDPQKEGRYRWISAFLKSVGLLTHHAAGSMIVSMLLNFVITPDRHIIGLSLILLMQHWFALVKYVSYPMYVALLLFLEFWFEWTVLSEYQFILANHWTNGLGVGTMVLAHWMFLLATAWDWALNLAKKFEDETTIEPLSLNDELDLPRKFGSETSNDNDEPLSLNEDSEEPEDIESQAY